jgi:phosphate transport system substrate-binding protein
MRHHGFHASVCLACTLVSGFGASASFAQSTYPAALPRYVPAPVAVDKSTGYILRDGTVRIVGPAGMRKVVTVLNDYFTKTHPGVRFVYFDSDDSSAISSLIFNATAFAPLQSPYGGGIGYSDIVQTAPFYIRIAHGSLNPEARVSPFAVIVNPLNHLERLSLGTISAIFTMQLRSPVLAAWNQVPGGAGLNSERIDPCGLPWTDHYPSEELTFGDEVFYRRMGGAPPVNDYRMFKTYAEVVQHVAQTPAAISIVPLNRVTSGVRVVGLVDGIANTVRTGTAAEIESGQYPLDRSLYLYGRVKAGKPLDPFVAEYMRMVLSQEGQQLIADEGEGYLPLNAFDTQAELLKFQ